jgi:hypothetical protein
VPQVKLLKQLLRVTFDLNRDALGNQNAVRADVLKVLNDFDGFWGFREPGVEILQNTKHYVIFAGRKEARSPVETAYDSDRLRRLEAKLPRDGPSRKTGPECRRV